MDKFNGFSQDEINRVSGNKKKPAAFQTMKSAASHGHGGIRRMPDTKESLRQQNMSQLKQQNQITPTRIKSSNSNDNLTERLKNLPTNDSENDINPDRSMSKSIEEALFFQPLANNQQQTLKNKADLPVGRQNLKKYPIKIDRKSQATQGSNNSLILEMNSEMDNQISTTCTNSSADSSILDSIPKNNNIEPPSQFVALNVQSPFKGISLKDFESHRKMIEEQNRQKKEILHKAIEQHSQKTAAETRKIEEIKTELAKLDNDLAVDVALLRKQIDNACIHFAAVEKHYMKIEAQFLKAKVDLHKAAEKKELLTEHLCTVITHNEDRKAQKLTELMQKVGLSANGVYEPPTSTSK